MGSERCLEQVRVGMHAGEFLAWHCILYLHAHTYTKLGTDVYRTSQIFRTCLLKLLFYVYVMIFANAVNLLIPLWTSQKDGCSAHIFLSNLSVYNYKRLLLLPIDWLPSLCLLWIQFKDCKLKCRPYSRNPINRHHRTSQWAWHR